MVLIGCSDHNREDFKSRMSLLLIQFFMFEKGLSFFCVLILSATFDGGTAHGGKRLPWQPHTRSDGGAAWDAGEEDGAKWGVQRQLDRPHRQPDEGRGAWRGGHSPVNTPTCPAYTPQTLWRHITGVHLWGGLKRGESQLVKLVPSRRQNSGCVRGNKVQVICPQVYL